MTHIFSRQELFDLGRRSPMVRSLGEALAIAVSDRGTLRSLTQFGFAGSVTSL